MILFCFIPVVISLGYDQVGQIVPSGSLPISNSITNRAWFSDYTFTFKLSNDLPSGGSISIEFPTQFEANLGIAGNPTCSISPCSLSGNTVSLSVSSRIPFGQEVSITINSIKNPSKSGGTGNFKLQTFYYSYLIDMNLVFGSIGISDSPSELALVSVSVLPGSSDIAGDISKYLFTFQSTVNIPAGSWMLFKYPNSGVFIPENPSCSSYSSTGLNVAGDLQCRTSALTVNLTGITEDLYAGSQYNIRMTGTNPQWSATLGYFAVYIFRENTNTLLAFKENVKGFLIKTSDFLETSLSALDESVELARNSIILYKLHIRAKNPVEDRGFIIVEFPTTFTMDGDYLVWVDSGLEDFNYTDKISVEYSIPLLKLTISNFKAIPAERNIDIVLQLKNPSASGLSDSLNVYSLRPDGKTVIDLNSTAACVEVSSLNSPDLSVSYATQAIAGGIDVDLKILLVPNEEVPAEGFLSFEIPEEFGTGSLACKVTPYGVGTDSAKSCLVSSGKIWVQLFESTLNSPSGSGEFKASQQSSVQITLKSPVNSGYYFFDVATYDTSKNLLETGGVMVFIDAADFTSISIEAASTALSSPTVLIFKLTSSGEIPSGLSSEDYLSTRGYFEIQLPTQDSSGNYLFDLDLGLGLLEGSSVSCKGIVTITGLDTSELTCTVTTRPTVASIGTPVILTISDFYTIPSGTSFEFHIAGLHYMLTSNPGTVQVSAYSLTNRKKTLINSGTSTLASGSALPSVRDFSSSSSPSFLTTQIQELNELTLTFNTSAVSSSNSYLLLEINPTHDSGYCSTLDIECDISGSYKCYCYKGADLVLIYLPAGLALDTFELIVSNLVNPESVATTTDQMWLYIIDDNQVVDYVELGDMPSLTAGIMIHTAFFIDQTCAGCVNVGYEFYMRVLNAVPDSGSIVITLDASKSYSLHYSSPRPYCSYFSVNGIEVTSYKCTPYRNILTLSNVKFIETGSLIRVLLKGVKNPSVVGSLGTILYETRNKHDRVIGKASLSAGILDESLQVEDVDTALVSNFPTNEGALAEYSIFFSPIQSIGPGASIEIDFPARNFDKFVNPPDCRVSIGISFVKDCLFYGKTLRTTVNSEYHNSQITVHVLGIKNFAKGVSDSFEIRVIYDGVVLQRSSSFISVSTTALPSAIITTLIHFYPKNEAETATYEFHIIPSTSFDSNSYLSIEFPKTFDKRIGDNLECWAEGLKGYIKCSVIYSWTLQITDHDPYINCESCSITLFIWGVINPNYEKSSNTGQFKIGILQTDHFPMLNEASGELGMIPAAGYLNLWTTTAQNLYSRYDNTFTFNFTTSTSIPSSSNLGAVWLEFPVDYILSGSSISCSSSSSWSSGSPSCKIEFNTVKLFSSSDKIAGNLQVSVENICNPLFNLEAGYINLKVFDGYNNKVITRSFPNLSKNKFKYDYSGPLIHVSNDETFTAERGTISDYIKISFDYPCALSLSLTPYTFGFVFIPTSISLTVGDMEAYFRVSVPMTVDDTLYVIKWKIAGEVIPNYYTPINKSLFKVKKLKGVSITFQDIPAIPKSGTSIPIQVTLQSSPYSSIYLLFSISTMYSGLSILPQKMEFRAGHTRGFYTITVSNSTLADSSFISVSMSGENAEVFQLSKDEISFEIFDEDLVEPDVTSIAVTQVFRSSAKVVIRTSKVAVVYYAYALFGTIQPSFTELAQGGPPSYDTSEIIYGTVYISSTLVANLTLKGLAAGTSYSVFAICKDQRGGVSELARTCNFSTLPVFNPAIVSLWFSQTYLTSVEKEIIEANVALVLGLNSWQVIEANNKTSRRLASSTDQVITLFQVYLIDNPYSDDYPKPKDMIPILQRQRSYLAASLPNFNASAGITGQEVVLGQCSWHIQPYLLGTSDYRSISLAGALVEAGYLFGIAVPAVNDTGTPLGYQVAAGLDSANREAKKDYKKVELKTVGNLTFSNLQNDVNYNVYVVCGNLVPGFPQVSENVTFIRWKTDSAPAADLLQVDFDGWLGLVGWVLIFVFN